MGILDQGKFPLGEPMGQELLRMMAGFYLSERAAVRFEERRQRHRWSLRRSQ
jgi:hypothetical protein